MLISKKKLKIAFQGMPGAYSNMACEECFPNAKAIPCISFENMLETTKSKVSDLAMVPIENSVAGRVADIHNLIPESGLHIIGEHYQKVNHQLLALKGATLKTIKTVKSHSQGLAQCRKLIKQLNIAPVQHIDTAGAAYELSKGNDITVAAIASKMAAKIYGLKILKKNIEDELNNTTRFLIMSNKKHIPKYDKSKVFVTTIVFEMKSVPAALYKVLGGFATNGINLTKLESYISGKNMKAARFYVDAEGHPHEKGMQNALDEMKFYTLEGSIKILGSYLRNIQTNI